MIVLLGIFSVEKAVLTCRTVRPWRRDKHVAVHGKDFWRWVGDERDRTGPELFE
jgi:hypothetical protein